MITGQITITREITDDGIHDIVSMEYTDGMPAIEQLGMLRMAERLVFDPDVEDESRGDA